MRCGSAPGGRLENATYGPIVCAERVAVFKAISEGGRLFRRIAVAADGKKMASPCGPCRQILWEFCGDIEVVLVNLDGGGRSLRLSQLLPEPFDESVFR